MPERQAKLDSIRGAALVSMVIYHACWDLVYLFGMDWPWYHSFAAHLWQQSICWTFILLSGYCFQLGRRHLRSGLLTSLCGAAISAATCVIMPDEPILWGVLSLLGLAMLLTIPAQRLLEKIPAGPGLILSFALFILFRDVNAGYLGFEGIHLASLPVSLYQNLLTAGLGFPPAGFRSSDYFSLLPWLFLFWTGWFSYRLQPQRESRSVSFLAALGRHSLLIYMLHQPLIYGLLRLLFKAVGAA